MNLSNFVIILFTQIISTVAQFPTSDYIDGDTFVINDFKVPIVETDELEVKRIILDTDGGVDDCMAVTMVLAAHEIDIVAITTTAGVTSAKEAACNIKKTLEAVRTQQVPIYVGSEHPIISNPLPGEYFEHEVFDKFPLSQTPNYTKTEHAISYMIRMVERHPKRVTIVALGPLTNIALAMRLNSKFKDKVKSIYWTGGSIYGFGDELEFNSHFDPIATSIVLEESGTPIFMVPQEATEQCLLSSDWRKNVLGSLESDQMILFNKLEEGLQNIHNGTWRTRDTKTVLALITKRFIQKMDSYYVEAIWEGEQKGRTIVDVAKLSGRPPNAIVVQELNGEVYKEIVPEYLQRQLYIDSLLFMN